MVLGLKSPYNDDETRIKDAAKVLEKWIEDTWDNTRSGVNKTDILFGKKPEDMMTFNKEICLRCYTFYGKRDSGNYGNGRLIMIDSTNIEIWVMNNEDLSGYDARAIKIWKYIEEWLWVHYGDDHKGIYEVKLINAGLKPQPEKRNLTNPVILVEITYFADKLDLLP